MAKEEKAAKTAAKADNKTKSAPAQEKAKAPAKEEKAKNSAKESAGKATAKTKAEAPVKAKAAENEAAAKEEKKQAARNYHVAKRPDGKWQVKFAGGEKAIKLFSTQAEAIEYAKKLAENQDGSISIHKKDGKMRKQKY